MSTTIYAVYYSNWDEYWICGLFHSETDANDALEYMQEKHKKENDEEKYPTLWIQWTHYNVEEYEVTALDEWKAQQEEE